MANESHAGWQRANHFIIEATSCLHAFERPIDHKCPIKCSGPALLDELITILSLWLNHFCETG